jgi:hypothetical protein
VARHGVARLAAKRGLAPLHHRGFRLRAARLSMRTWRDFGMTGGRAKAAASGSRPVSAAADVLGGAS